MYKRTDNIVAFLSVYETCRAYGGPEEGGWYYDAYEHVCSVPFEASQEMEWHDLDEDDPNELVGWCPSGPIVPDDQEWVDNEQKRLELLYGITGERRSHCNDGWLEVHVESDAGHLERKPRPRYE